MGTDTGDKPKTWFEINPKKTLLAVFLFFLILFEILLRILAAHGLFPYQRHPTSFRPVYWDDIDPVVGIWRHPNATLRHTSPCFDVIYHSNSYGARDPERALKSGNTRRVVVLGDSFIEGFGVADGRRMTDLLEQRTGVEHLNFGSGGGFGSIQEWLIYANLASGFDHSDVFIFLLPCNDFMDNNPEFYPDDRYRPYLKKENGKFSVYYPVEFDHRKMEFRTPLETVKNIIDNSVYIANFLRWTVREIKVLIGLKQKPPDGSESPYYDRYTDHDLEILLYTYQQILHAAGNRQVYLFTVPIEQDFAAARKRGYDFKLVRALKRFAAGYENLHYNDLLVDFLEHAGRNGLPYRAYTLGCNPHWGNLGNRVAAEAVYRIVFNNLRDP
jgi:lysophospholipase L1-like esterase